MRWARRRPALGRPKFRHFLILHLRADDVDHDAGRDGRDPIDGGRDVGAEVGLVQHDHRRGAAPPDEPQVALDPTRVQVAVEGADEEDDVSFLPY